MASGYPNIGTGDTCVYFVDKTYTYLYFYYEIFG